MINSIHNDDCIDILPQIENKTIVATNIIYFTIHLKNILIFNNLCLW